MGPPYGVVGPLCNQGNRKILTHDFTHRLHMDIFDRKYYPPELNDWWMDDWISGVYGEARTHKTASIGVVHHSKEQAKRYDVDGRHEKLVRPLIDQGRRQIEEWVAAHS